MNDITPKQTGRKRILSDEDRIEKNREKSKNCIRFVPPNGYKDNIRKFVNENHKGNMNDFLFKLVNGNQAFKDFIKAQI